MTETQLLLAEIEDFLRTHDMRPTRFGFLACRDFHTVRRLRAGYGITLKRVEQIRAFMRTYGAASGNALPHRRKRPRTEAVAA